MEQINEQKTKKKMAEKTRIQAFFLKARKRLRKQLNKKYPEFLPTDGGVKQFHKTGLTEQYFQQMFNLKYNTNEKTKAINAPKKRR